MTVTLNLRPETQAGFEALAHAAGQSVADYLAAMVEGAAVSSETGLRTPEQRAAAWIESAGRFAGAPLLSDEAVSRESMYDGCE